MTLYAPASIDVALAVRRYLASITVCRSVLGPTGTDSENTVWLFTRDLGVVVEGSSHVAAVLRMDGAWTRPNSHNSAEFPRVSLELLADSSRTGAEITRPDAESRAWLAWDTINKFLHRTDAFSEMWGSVGEDPGLRVWGSLLLSHPDVFDIPDWVGGKRLQVHYGLSVG